MFLEQGLGVRGSVCRALGSRSWGFCRVYGSALGLRCEGVKGRGVVALGVKGGGLSNIDPS